MHRLSIPVSLTGFLLVCSAGCATVDVTKTANGFYAPTRADDVEILMTRPERKYVELGTVSTTTWNPSETAKMHNGLRTKAAPLGASAVIITDSGIMTGPYNTQRMWTTGVAVRYEDATTQPTSAVAKP
jgi:hypothetical protein